VILIIGYLKTPSPVPFALSKGRGVKDVAVITKSNIEILLKAFPLN
jgi:hypothetical protein